MGSLSCYEDYVGIMFPNKKESENIEKRVIKEIEDLGFGLKLIKNICLV